MKEKLAALALCLLLLGGCAAPPAAESRPPEPEPSVPREDPWEGFRDLAGERLAPDSGELKALTLSYTLGWVPWEDGYTRLEQGGKNGNAVIGEAEARYSVQRRRDAPAALACDRSGYTLRDEEIFTGTFPVSGILQADDRAVLFFPYREDPTRFYSLHPREKDREALYEKFCRRTAGDGTAVEIQPVGIQFHEEEEEKLRALLPSGGREQPCWFDATLSLSGVTVSGFSDGEGVEVFATRAFGYFRDPIQPEDVALGKELTFSQVIGPEMQYWIYWGVPMEE